MTFDEFIVFRNTKIKNNDHKRIGRLFYPYLSSVSGDTTKLPRLLGSIISVDLSGRLAITGCFNGINDDTVPPCDDVDFYVKLDNGIKIFVYGRIIKETHRLNENEYVIFCTSDKISLLNVKKENHHIYL